MQVIALVGLAQCGKTTLAKEIAKVAFERGMNPRIMSFAGALKRAAVEVGASKDTQPELYRRFCQEAGANMRDPQYIPGVTNPDWWVQRTREDLRRLQAEDDAGYGSGKGGEIVAIFDDVRFDNELNMLKEMQAVRIYIDREEELPDPTGKWREHDSERMAYDIKYDHDRRMRDFDFQVCSAGSMDNYLTRCRLFIPTWLGLETVL